VSDKVSDDLSLTQDFYLLTLGACTQWKHNLFSEPWYSNFSVKIPV